MSVVINSSYVIPSSLNGGGTLDGDNPLIGYDNLVTVDTIITDTAAAGFPAINMANPSTALKWIGVGGSPSADEHVTVTTETDNNQDVDYIAIARHNLGSEQIPVGVDYLDPGSPTNWTELIAPVILPNDGPALFRFPPLAYAAIRLRLQGTGAAPQIAVVYCGKLLVLQRRIYVGHTPINYGRMTKVANGKSESGNFLGRIILNEMKQTSFSMKNLTPDWYREYLDPFVAQAQEFPFFFAWRPDDYPREVGFCWMTDDPVPKNERSNGMMGIDFSIAGVA